ncbi:hypothetical protein AAG906_017272 [Vitis piasezkii]
MIPVFPCLAHPTLMSGKHFVLKDMPFYEKEKTVVDKGSSSKSIPIFLTIVASPATPIVKPPFEEISFYCTKEPVTILGGVVLNSQGPPIVVAHIDVSGREKLDELLNRFPTFIDMEPLVSNMNDIFRAPNESFWGLKSDEATQPSIPNVGSG